MGIEPDKKQNLIVSPMVTQLDTDADLIKELRQYIEQARLRVARADALRISLSIFIIYC